MIRHMTSFLKISLNYIAINENSFLEPRCGVVYVRRNGQHEITEIDINQITPIFLRDVFNLESFPSHLRAESNNEIVPILQSNVVPNEYYTIEDTGPKTPQRRRKRSILGNRAGNFLHLFFSYFNVAGMS